MNAAHVFTFLVASALVMSLPSSLYAADINVNVSGNEAGSSNSVEVYNSVTSTINGNSSSSVSTDITITNNGVTKTYHSNSPGSISVQSENGNSTVKVDNQVQPPASSNGTPSTKVVTESDTNEGEKREMVVEEGPVSVYISVNPNEFSVVESTSIKSLKKVEENDTSFITTITSFLSSLLKM